MNNKEVVQKFGTYLEARDYAENTRTAYLANVVEFLKVVEGECDSLDDSHKIIYDKYLVEKDYSLTTCNAKISAVITFLKFLHVRSIYKNDLYTMFEFKRNANANSKPHKVPTIDELSTILDYVRNLPDTFFNQRKKVIILFFIFTGVRRDESINLKWSNIDIEKSRVFIDKAKRSEFRYVSLNKEMIEEVLVWKQMCKEKNLDSDYIFVTANNKQMTNREMNYSVEGIMSNLGMEYTPHSLRKGCATSMYVNHDIKEIQKLLGHSNSAVTELYVQPQYESNMAENNVLTKM